MTSWGEQDRVWADVFDRAIANHGRSQQTAVGPSQLGIECNRGLLVALSGQREAHVPYSGWQATVGTAVHAWAEQALQAENDRLGRIRYLSEQRVFVGGYADREVWGTADAFDLDTFEVLDFKTASKTSLRRHRADIGVQHRVQRACYGLAFERMGLTPKTVANWYIPRDGALTDSFFDRAPYDRTIADEALERAGRLQTLLDAVGLERAMAEFEPCDGPWCSACPTRPTSIFD